MLDCDDETWNLVVKADNNADTLRFKSFPYFPVWSEIFGKDRANGQKAEDVLDAFNNLLREDIAAGIPIEDEDCGVDIDENGDTVEGNSICGGDVGTGVTSKHDKKKRKVGTDSDSEQLRELVGSIVSTNNELKDANRLIGYEHGLGQKREMIFNLLSSVSGLTDLVRYDLADIIGKDSDRLEIFCGLPAEHRGLFLSRLMERLGGF